MGWAIRRLDSKRCGLNNSRSKPFLLPAHCDLDGQTDKWGKCRDGRGPSPNTTCLNRHGGAMSSPLGLPSSQTQATLYLECPLAQFPRGPLLPELTFC